METAGATKSSKSETDDASQTHSVSRSLVTLGAFGRHIEQVPDSILLEVFQHLKFRDLCIAGSVCRRWYRVSRDQSLRRVVDLTSVPFTVSQAWSLIRHQLNSHVLELRVRGSVQFFHTDHSRWRTRSFTSKSLAYLVERCPSLQVLHLRDTFIANNTVSTKVTVAELPPSLTHLVLRGSFLHPSEFFRPDPSKALRRLAFLDVSYCTLVTSGELGRFANWTSLRALGLEGCHRVNDGGMTNVEPILRFLQAIDLEGTDVGDKGVELILTRGPGLRFLFLGHTGFTGIAFVKLAAERKLRGHRFELTRVCLRRTTVNEAAVFALLQLAPRLTWFVGSGPHLSAETTTRVKERLPSCRFVKFAPFELEQDRCCRHFTKDVVRTMKFEGS
ncbi:hypothetical protein HPB47_022513 [Ixodes persulcatus]|uniref:Uncharacterized protein n=1 Tax=Ixodes persulcatus TaxID=34615 RepID=A0AC60QA55_IXOPE|nr:hypothetical protein HPB47_022513 [Ixodes persulcatus]